MPRYRRKICVQNREILRNVATKIQWFGSIGCSAGLVLELTDHKKDDASKYLTLKGEYILVEKRVISIPSTDPNETSPQQEITYIPLLKRLSEKFPHYETRVAQKIPSPGILNSGKTKSTKKGRRRKGNVDWVFSWDEKCNFANMLGV